MKHQILDKAPRATRTEAEKEFAKTLKRTIDLSERGNNPRIVQSPGKVRASKSWEASKADRTAISNYQVPVEHLAEFLASGLSPSEFLAQSDIAIAPKPVIEPKPKKSGSVYRPEPTEATNRNQLERNAIELYRKEVKGVTEVPTTAGRIDLLTESDLIEFKLAHNWKHALGQLLVYGFYYPDHQLVLMLVGSQSKHYSREAKKHCSRYGILVKTF